MQKDNEEQDYFQAEPHTHVVQQVIVSASSLLGQANPIYSKKLQKLSSELDAPVTLKILPVLRKQQISLYSCFKLSKAKSNYSDLNKKFNQQQNQQEGPNRVLGPFSKQYKYLIAKNNAFNKFYEGADMPYLKFNNLRHNVLRDISYFAGIFISKDEMSKKRKQFEDQGKSINNILSLIQSKNKNRPSSLSVTPIPINSLNPQNSSASKSSKLVFDSNFQSGNLFAVFRTGKYSYDLVVNNDTNSKGSTQWFYFSVQGIEPNVDYKFSIVNFTKKDSLFNYGMKPAFYSMLQNKGISPHLQKQRQNTLSREQKVGWYRYGKDVQYYKSQIQRQNNMNKYYYILTFTINWKISGDRLYLAHSYPYTYSKLCNLMNGLMNKYQKNESQKFLQKRKQEKKSVCIQQIKIGKSVANRQLCAYLISSKKTSKQSLKQAIIIMARQHPGETQGSFVCEGVINRLTQSIPSKQAAFLLQNYLVYVIPMINPDGVAFGNYRTNLYGKDLNRKWDGDFNSLITPEVSAVKQFMANLTTNSNISIRFVLDLHGHSKKLNSFFYGNPCPENPELSKIYPYICSRFSQAIQFMDCTFTSEKYKRKAARIYLSSVFKQLHVYTFQASFYGYNNRQGNLLQFTPTEYFKLGKVLVNGLYLLLVKEKKHLPIETQQIKNFIENQQKNSYKSSIEIYNKFEQQLKENQLLLKVGDADSSGSQSKPEQGELNIEQIPAESENQQNDDRVVVNNKMANSNEQQKQKQKIQISKTKSIRINSRKPIVESTIEYKDKGRLYKNKKLATISQVNAVLPDKYHISLLPIERISYRTGKTSDAETQTEREEKLIIRHYKIFEIQQKSNLVVCFDNKEQHPEEGNTPIFVQKNNIQQKYSQPKKHAEIVAQIERNSRHQIYRDSSQIEKDLINKRKLSQGPNLKSIAVKKQRKAKKREISTQTIVSFKGYQNKDNKSFKGLQSPSRLTKITENDLRIAKMQKINQEVLKIYSKKSAVIDLSLKYQSENAARAQLQKKIHY